MTEYPEGMAPGENAPTLPAGDPGNLDVMNPRHEISMTPGFVKLVNGKDVYVITFRSGVVSFTLPFHGGKDQIKAFAQMLLDHAESTDRPSGLIVPQPGTPIPNLRRMR
jgi:hypothetical protein